MKCNHDWQVKGWTWCTCIKCGKNEQHPEIASDYWSKIFSRYDGTGLITPDLCEKLHTKGVKTDEQKKLQCITEIERSIRNIDNMLLIIKKQNKEFDAKYDAMQKQNEEFADKQASMGYDWPRMPERIQDKPVFIESNSGSMITKGSLPEAKYLWILFISVAVLSTILIVLEYRI